MSLELEKAKKKKIAELRKKISELEKIIECIQNMKGKNFVSCRDCGSINIEPYFDDNPLVAFRCKDCDVRMDKYGRLMARPSGWSLW